MTERGLDLIGVIVGGIVGGIVSPLVFGRDESVFLGVFLGLFGGMFSRHFLPIQPFGQWSSSADGLTKISRQVFETSVVALVVVIVLALVIFAGTFFE